MANNSPHSGERIAKVIARAGLASRREAEQWIVAGRVAVNGAVIASPALNVTAADSIAVDGQPLRQRERTRLFLYNKPRGLVTTNSDPEGRPTIFAALPKNLPRLISIGRLDMNSEGLLLLTNDGALARALELPQTAWLRRYRARALGRTSQEALDKLSGGVTVDGIHYGPVEATLDRDQGANLWLTIGIREGKNREVRNVLGHLGLKVNRLIRTAFGPFELGKLDDGEVEEVTIENLRTALGETLIKEAGVDFNGPSLDHKALRHSGARANAREPAIQKQNRKYPTESGARNDKGSGERATARSWNARKQRRDRSSGPRPSRPKPSSKPKLPEPR